MGLTIKVDETVEDFLKYAGPLLYKDEPTNSLMLGYCIGTTWTKEPSAQMPIFIRILKDGLTTTAAVKSARNLILTYPTSEEIKLIANHLEERGSEFPGVVGPSKESELFATTWSKLKRKQSMLGMGQKIYKIEKVDIPSAQGSLRLAHSNETDLITQWIVEFSEESLPPLERKSFEERHPQAIRAINNQLVYVWAVNGVPVSMAQVSRPTQNGISVNAVYTPKHLRKNGFASAVVAHLSQKMLDSGKKFCVLYNDLSNPTSNKIYQKIGYQEVSDSMHFLFENLASVRTPTSEEFKEVSTFSFQNFVEETSKSSGQSNDELKNKLGGPPSSPGPNDIWYIIEKKDQRIGFIWIKIDRDKKSAFGYDIYLNPDQRSQGIGRQVMQLCGAELRKMGIGSVSICVFHRNEVARSLYSSLGFVESDFNKERQQYTLTLSLEK